MGDGTAVVRDEGAWTRRRRFLTAAAKGFLRVMRANPLTFIGFIMVVIIAVLALLILVFPPMSLVSLGHAVSVLPYDPAVADCPPALSNAAGNCASPPSGTHALGTYNLTP